MKSYHNFLVCGISILCMICSTITGCKEEKPKKTQGATQSSPDSVTPPQQQEIPAPAQRFGLVLAKRKEIFQALVKLEDRADRWPKDSLFDHSQNLVPAQKFPEIPAELKNPTQSIAGRYRLKIETVEQIGREGIEHHWKLPEE